MEFTYFPNAFFAILHTPSASTLIYSTYKSIIAQLINSIQPTLQVINYIVRKANKQHGHDTTHCREIYFIFNAQKNILHIPKICRQTDLLNFI